MNEETKRRRPRGKLTDELKTGAVRLVLEEGKTVTEVALRLWVEREELVRLRKENRRLLMERILSGDEAIPGARVTAFMTSGVPRTSFP